jgi:FtsZ-interacting cell division protein ZipA
MEIVIIVLVAIALAGWWIWKEGKHESSGSHPLDGATKNSVLDVNQDGKVDLKDAVAAAEVVVEKTKKTATKAKTVAKATASKVKTAAKKTAANKTAAKKSKAK